MKQALVLGGGGSKGAYEIGVWKALRECNITFDLVCGTSIGAMIGAMIVQDQYEECYQLWDQMRVEDVIANGINLDFDMELLMSQKGKYKTIVQSYMEHKGADITPFEEMVDHLFDEKRFFSSKVDFACMSVNVSRMQPHAFTKGEMRCSIDPRDALLASAACFPAFPMRKIRGENYIDGGYYDNVPIQLARSLGADQIIAVDLKSVGTKKVWQPQSDVCYIEPYVTLGSFLLFDHQRIQRNMRLGYLDAMKKLGHQLGYIYTFPKKDRKHIDRWEEGFQAFHEGFSIPFRHQRISELYHSLLARQLSSSMQEYADYDHPYLRILELCAFVFDINDEQIYSFFAFLRILLECVETYTPSYDKLFDQKKTPAQIMEFIKDFSMRDLVYYTYHKLAMADEMTTKTLKLLAIGKPDCFLLGEMLLYCGKIAPACFSS